MKRLLLSIAVTLTSLLVAIFTAFAWFSSNDTVTAEDAMVSVSASDKIKRLDPTVWSLTNTANGYLKDTQITEMKPFNGDALTTALIQIDYEVTEPGYYTLDLGYTGAMYTYSAIKYVDSNTPIVTFLSNALAFWNVGENSVDSTTYFIKDGLSETFLHYSSATEHFDKDIADWRVTGNALKIGLDDDGNVLANPVLSGTAYILIDYSETLINELYTAILNNADGGNITGASFDFTSDLIINMSVGSDSDWVEPDVYYQFNYDSNGGTGTIESITALSTLSIQIPQSGIVRNNYYLVGWNTSPDGTGTTFNLGQVYNVSEFVQYDTDKDYNITLYALWTASSFEVKYDSNIKGVALTNQIAPTSGNVTLLSTIYTNQYYKLSGWNTSSDGTGTTYQLGQSVAVSDLGLTNNNASITLYAIWTENYYTVQFDKNSNNATGTMDDQKIDIAQPTALSKNTYLNSGYAFGGWNTQADGLGTTYKDVQVVTGLVQTNGESITLYAIWTENKYYVEFNANGGSGEMQTQIIELGINTPLSTNAFTYTKHIFTGWNTVANGTGISYTDGAIVKDIAALNETIILYAQWQETFTISFEDQTFGYNVDPISDITSIPNDLEELNKTGYYFFGWYTDEDLKTKAVSGDKLTNDITLYAKWQRVLLEDDFNSGTNILNGYQGMAKHQGEVSWSEGMNLYVKHKNTSTDELAQQISQYEEVDSDSNDNYIAYSNGAYTLVDNNSVLATIAYMNFDEPINSGFVYGRFDVTFTAADSNNWAFFSVMGTYNGVYGELFAIRLDGDNIFQYRVNDSSTRTTINTNLVAVQNQSYTIEFELDLSSGKVNLYVTTEGTTYDVSFTDSNFNAISAFSLTSSETGSKSVIFDNVLVTTTADLQPSVRFYNKLTGAKVNTLVIGNDGKVTIPSALSQTGYVWGGWQLADGTEVNANTTFTGGEKVYGIFTPITYTIIFDDNGKETDENFEMANQVMTYDVAATLSPNSFGNEKFNFVGWNTKADGSGTFYNDQQSVINLCDEQGETITLYAQWQAI